MLTIYKASAGSGKTYRLAYEYIKSLLGIKNPATGAYTLNRSDRPTTRNHHRGILAITFTNKATAEMKRRIVREIGRLAVEPAPGAAEHADYAARLTATFGCSRHDLALAAASALRQLLYDYSYFNVSTIDSFFQTVLRTFAREVDRQGDFEIEMRDKFAVSSGIALMLDDINYGNPPQAARLMRWITDFTMRRLDEAKAFNVFNRSNSIHKALISYVSMICNESFKKSADKTIAYLADPDRIQRFAKACRDCVDSLYADLERRASKTIAVLSSEGFGASDLKYINKYIYDFMAAGIPLSAEQLGFGKSKTVNTILEATTPEEVAKAVFMAGAVKKKGLPSATVVAELRSLFTDARICHTRAHVCQMLADNCENLEFLGLTWEYIDRFRRDNNLILLSDTNDLLKRIINGAEMPFIYERLGVTLHNFLIDEFQDTSHLQWENLRPLVGNSLASNNDNLIIGDEKQSIYRFRNADSSLLGWRVADCDFPSSHRIEGDRVEENTNWRSAPGVVRFNNTLFRAMAADMGVRGFGGVTQAIAPKRMELTSLIDVRVLRPDPDNADNTPADRALRLMAADIKRQHDAGYDWNDIAVLVRDRAEAAMAVNYLMEHHPDIEVVSDEALLLVNCHSVKLIMSILNMLDTAEPPSAEPSPVESKLHTSMSDIVMMMSRFEFYLAAGADCADALTRAISDSDSSHTIADSLEELRRAHPSNLVALVETVISCCLPEEKRLADLPFIAAFQDEVINYCSVYNPSVHAFIEWWNANSAKLAVNSSPAQQAVKVMTIHKSKGLEWDCVHIPFANWEVTRQGEQEWVGVKGKVDFIGADPDDVPPVMLLPLSRRLSYEGSPFADDYNACIAEQTVDNLNLTYVAFTRAGRELIIHTDGTEIADHILNAITSTSDPDPDSGLYVDLRRHYDPNAGLFSMGCPTAPVRKESDDDTDPCPEPKSAVTVPDGYPVFFRDETRQLTSIADLTTASGDILFDDEPEPGADAVEPAPAGAPSEVLEAARRGRELHAILSFINVPSDLDGAVRQATFACRIDPADAESYSRLLSDAFTSADPRIDRWFSPEARTITESSIYVPERHDTHRPDRVVIHPDGSVDVVDYKFTTRHLDSHDKSTRGYVALMRAMGYDNVRGYLWYPAKGEIIDL